jgi:putative ATP-binding cassette transporter
MKRFGQLGRNVWVLTRGYWGSEERWSAWALLATVIALSLGLVYVSVLLNTASGAFGNALQNKDQAAFFSAFGTIMLLILLYLAVALLKYFLNQTLQLRWRRWLTDRYLTRWLADRTFYRMRFSGHVDNPDQRISEDIKQFITQTLSLGLGLMSSVVTLASFAVILWRLSGSVTVPLLGLHIVVPGYMFWVAVLYSGIGSVFAHLIGKPLIHLSNRQQGVEADFRFSLVRLREEAEGIALYRGEEQEHGIALRQFAAVYANFMRLIRRNTLFYTYQITFGQLGGFFPYLVAAPRFFAGAIQYGGLIQTSNAFGQVNDSLSWFINSYQTFADWRATVDRLIEFSGELDMEAATVGMGAQRETAAQSAIDLKNVEVELPNGVPLIAEATIHFEPGEATLLQGSSGSGKSTLFRVLAGLWPFAKGRIELPAGATTLFLPQRPYMPIGTLRDALWFPAKPPPASDDETRAALAAVNLPDLAARLDEAAHWSQVLSPGEQQRLSIARALLNKPDWLFLDEATSAMDEDYEAALYRTLAALLPKTTVVSIGHRHSLAAYHRRRIRLDRASGQVGRLVEEMAVP